MDKLIEIRDAYEYMGEDPDLDWELINTIDDMLVLHPNEKLKNLADDYQSYCEDYGSDSMMFSDLLYAAIAHAKTSF